MKILIIEDDPSLQEIIKKSLEKERYVVETADNYQAALLKLDDYDYDCILLDIMLPGGSGLQILESLKKEKRKENVIIISAKDSWEDKVAGLDLGADDYITKPFSLMVLISKVNALMRRTSLREESKRIIRCRNLSFYPEEMKLLINNEEVILSKNEYKLLNCLIKNSGQIVTKGQLLEALWDKDGAFVDENTVAVNIRRLREKIEDIPSEPVFIKNIRGIGYRWNEEIS